MKRYCGRPVCRLQGAGTAYFDVPLSDSITGFKVSVDALSAQGAVGSASTRIETFLPLSIDAQLPSQLTVGDEYALSAVVSNFDKGARSLKAKISLFGGLTLKDKAEKEIALEKSGVRPLKYTVVANKAGPADVLLSLYDDKGKEVDALKRTLKVISPGRHVREIKTARVKNGSGRAKIAISEKAIDSSVRGKVTFFRGSADLAVDGLSGMLKEPYGCFEQTSSTTYPNLLILNLLKDRKGHEKAVRQAREFIARGYQRLISYEVDGGGFSWFGDSPANKALTAFGLMEFVDMAQVYPVDPDLIKRTRNWLIKKQHANGSWSPDKGSLHDWDAVQGRLSMTAYVSWALAQTGYRGPALKRALRYLRTKRSTLTRRPYLLALWAAAETKANPKAAGALKTILAASDIQAQHLRLSAKGQTLFYARGRGADVQTTALAAETFFRSDHPALGKKALSWLWKARAPNYGWGTTQSTILALRAATFEKRRAPPKGTVDVAIDGKKIGSVDLSAVKVPTLALPKGLKSGDHTITLSADQKTSVNVDIRYSYIEKGLPRAVEQGLKLELATTKRIVRKGGTRAMTLKLENPSDHVVAMPTIVVPVPPGSQADKKSLRLLVRRGAISKFEDVGSAVYLYLKELKPKQTRVFHYTLKAIAECKVTQRAATAFAYYDPEIKAASENLKLTTLARIK